MFYLSAAVNVTKRVGSCDEDGVEERAEARTHRSSETKPLLLGLGWAPYRGTKGEQNHVFFTLRGIAGSMDAICCHRAQSNEYLD